MQLLDNIIRCAGNVIMNRACLVFGIHFLRAFVFFIFDRNTGFFFKLVEQLRVKVFAVIQHGNGIRVVFAAASCKAQGRKRGT